jgi:hypothetical protein
MQGANFRSTIRSTKRLVSDDFGGLRRCPRVCKSLKNLRRQAVTAEEILPLSKQRRRKPTRPQPEQKPVWASLLLGDSCRTTPSRDPSTGCSGKSRFHAHAQEKCEWHDYCGFAKAHQEVRFPFEIWFLSCEKPRGCFSISPLRRRCGYFP